MIIENQRLLSLNDLSMNDRLKLFSNNLLLKETAIKTVSSVLLLATLCFEAAGHPTPYHATSSLLKLLSVLAPPLALAPRVTLLKSWVVPIFFLTY